LLICDQDLMLVQPLEAVEDPVCLQFHLRHAMIWLTLTP
jgi:hypothetical protein